MDAGNGKGTGDTWRNTWNLQALKPYTKEELVLRPIAAKSVHVLEEDPLGERMKITK